MYMCQFMLPLSLRISTVFNKTKLICHGSDYPLLTQNIPQQEL